MGIGKVSTFKLAMMFERKKFKFCCFDLLTF